MSAIIAGYARTPFTRFTGSLSAISAVELGVRAIRSALLRAAVLVADVDRVYVGQALQAGSGQNPARQSAVAAGIPFTVAAMTLNAVCLSGIEAVSAAAALIDSGPADLVIAADQESMSRAPHTFTGRVGTRYGSVEMIDTLELDGLTDAFERRLMGASTEDGNTNFAISREAQDAWAAESHSRSVSGAGFRGGEIEPFVIESRKSRTVVNADHGVRPETTTETLASLRLAFSTTGRITAGDSSQITDGSAALALLSERYAKANGDHRHRHRRGERVRCRPRRAPAQPANAIAARIAGLDISASDLAPVEINEAFASVVVRSIGALGVDAAIVNRHGGAIALGHPIGASGARIVGTLARDLADRGDGSSGAEGICGGGGQGSAVVLRSIGG